VPRKANPRRPPWQLDGRHRHEHEPWWPGRPPRRDPRRQPEPL